MASKRDDLQYGLSSEDTALPTFNEHFGVTFTKQGGYSVMDYVAKNNTVYLELKTRRVNHNQYPDIIIGQNKVDFCKDPTKTYYFAWRFYDGIYYIKYDRELFRTFRCDPAYQRGSRVDCYDRPSAVVFVPTKLMTKLELTKPAA